jgi:aminomethyltransferase
MTAPADLKRTPFHARHLAAGAKMVPFAGFEMPVTYPKGLIAEHNAVRNACGVFDVSHMGEFVVRGPQALEFVQAVTTNDASALAVGQAQYSAFLNARGTFEDDCLVYRFADHYLLVVNASNKDKDFAHISHALRRFDATLHDVSDDIALLAVQGPNTVAVLQGLTDVDLSAIKYYHFGVGSVAGVPGVTVSRTGYTGEDGFELYFDAAQAERVWDALMASGAVEPAGLGCRDTLRLEMGMALYGNDIDDTVNPYEAGLGWIVKLAKGDFTGKAALEAAKAAGLPHKLVGFTIAERGAIPRKGYPVFVDGAPSHQVCSGTMSPTLGIAIGTAYVPLTHTAPGSIVEIEIRGKRVPATVTKFPFYQRPGKG